MKVKELIEILNDVNQELEVKGFWEAQIKDISAISIFEDDVLLDVDFGFYTRRMGNVILYNSKNIE